MKNTIGYILVSTVIFGLYFFSRSQNAQPDTIIPRDDRVTVNFLDIGQGDAIYIRTNTNEDILIDGGPVSYNQSAKILKELSQVMPLTDKEFDLVVATHNHADHLGGLIEVMKKYRAKEIWISGAIHTTKTYLDWLETLRKQKSQRTTIKKVQLGEKKPIGRIVLSVIHPLSDMESQNPKDQHDANIAIKLTDGNVSFLLSGDLNETHEQNILQAFGADKIFLRSQIFKVPHSGSKSSLLPEFLATVQPKIAVISVGSNSYGHPAPLIINKLESAGVKIYRTDQNERIIVFSDGEKYEVKNSK